MGVNISTQSSRRFSRRDYDKGFIFWGSMWALCGFVKEDKRECWGNFYGNRKLWKLRKRNGKFMEKCVSDEYVFVCVYNGKMVERLDVFVVFLCY